MITVPMRKKRKNYALQVNRDFDTKGAETVGSHVTGQHVQIEWHSLKTTILGELCISSQTE